MPISVSPLLRAGFVPTIAACATNKRAIARSRSPLSPNGSATTVARAFPRRHCASATIATRWGWTISRTNGYATPVASRPCPTTAPAARPALSRPPVRVYNPEIGDGRGFLFGQLHDGAGRRDLGTKVGQTPWSRGGDGRLTLKGAVRNPACRDVEALGVYLKTFSVVETGDRCGAATTFPTRSAVMTRPAMATSASALSSASSLWKSGHMAQLSTIALNSCQAHPAGGCRTRRSCGAADHLWSSDWPVAASWMVAGFVGVLNTDNMNISAELRLRPWRFCPSGTGLRGLFRPPGALCLRPPAGSAALEVPLPCAC